MREYQVSCPKFTVLAVIDDNNIIKDTAAITRRFKGQRIAFLLQWAKKISGEVQIYDLRKYKTGIRVNE
jgi:hypothetical protein